MESGVIPDSDLSASLPPFDKDFSTYGVHRARLHLREPPHYGYRAEQRSRSGSSAEENRTWITVKLRNETIITGISTQGYGDTRVKEWVTKYTLMYSTGEDLFHFKDTSGNIEVSKCLFMTVIQEISIALPGFSFFSSDRFINPKMALKIEQASLTFRWLKLVWTI